MTIAAEQCRLYIVRGWPGTPISRFACRDTAGGGISQHSAYGGGGIDSNAIDIFGPGKTSGPADQEWIQSIVDDLTPNLDRWSIRKIIWRDGGAHENHAHADFYPMITDHKWCGAAWDPTWRYSDGSTIVSRSPEPENGRWDGSDGSMEYRSVINCPHSHGEVLGWVKNVIDWGIDVSGIIVVGDEHTDDWEEIQYSGGLWTNFFRYDAYRQR